MNLRVRDDLYITEVLETDSEAYIKYLNDPEITKFIELIPYPYTRQSFEWWWGFLQAQKKERGRALNWAIRKNGELIGGVGLKNLEGHRGETGSWLGREYHGRGIATDVKKVFTKFLLGEFELKRIEAHTFAPNAASVRVLEKCGFLLEGRLKKYYHHRGEFFDRLVFAYVI